MYFLFLFPSISVPSCGSLGGAVEAGRLTGSGNGNIEGAGGGGEGIIMREASRVIVIDVPPYDSPASCGAR